MPSGYGGGQSESDLARVRAQSESASAGQNGLKGESAPVDDGLNIRGLVDGAQIGEQLENTSLMNTIEKSEQVLVATLEKGEPVLVDSIEKGEPALQAGSQPSDARSLKASESKKRRGRRTSKRTGGETRSKTGGETVIIRPANRDGHKQRGTILPADTVAVSGKSSSS